MIFPLTGMVLGALLGAWRAKAKGGTTLDLLQWAAVYAILLGLAGLFVLIGVERSYL